MYNTIFFDLDGTLTDSSMGVYNAIYYALDEMGLPHPPVERMPLFIGPPLLETFGGICGLNEEEAHEALRLYRVYYSRQGLFENTVYDGMEECLKRLKEAGKRLAVATSKPEGFSRQILIQRGLDIFFDFVAGASLDESRNNKPKVLAYGLEQLQITDTKEVLMVGDRYHDVEGAAQFGIDCLGVLFGFGSREELLGAGACAVAETPAQVADFVLNCK